MHDQKRGVVGRSVCYGARSPSPVLAKLDRTAQEQRFGRERRVMIYHAARERFGLHLQKVRGAVPVYDRLDAARLILIAEIAFELSHSAAGSEKRGQVPAPPMTPTRPMRSGSRLYREALARNQRMAALQSSICAGNLSSQLKR